MMKQNIFSMEENDMYKHTVLVIGFLGIVLTACGFPIQATPTPATEPNSTGPDQAEQPEYVRAAIQVLVEAKGLGADEISVVSVEAVDWSDSCLGLGGPAESCAQVITPGYRIILEAGGEEAEFHTDATGQSVRQKTE